jgi:hypothetical protein
LTIVKTIQGITSNRNSRTSSFHITTSSGGERGKLQITPFQANFAPEVTPAHIIFLENSVEVPHSNLFFINRLLKKATLQHNLEFNIALVKDDSNADISTDLIQSSAVLKESGTDGAICSKPIFAAHTFSIRTSSVATALATGCGRALTIFALQESGQFRTAKTSGFICGQIDSISGK